MTDLTREQIEALLDGATPGPWACHFGNDNITCDCKYVLADYGGMGSIATIDVCKEMHGEWGDDNGPSVDVAKANARLIAAVPDLARQLLATLDALADAQARGMEMALKTYRTGAGVDNGNYPLWAYDADYETAVRKKAEVHRKAASDRATRKGI